MPTKELIVVGGPNGSGKSTFVKGYLAKRQCTYLCADQVATEFPNLDPISQQIAAGREFLRRLDLQLASDDDFVVETTLSGRTMRDYILRAHAAGFSITILFVFLNSADTCVARVAERVRRGGHHVPEADVRRRFSRSLANFWHIYRKIADQWTVVYNAGDGHAEVASGISDDFLIIDDVLFRRFLELAGVQEHG